MISFSLFHSFSSFQIYQVDNLKDLCFYINYQNGYETAWSPIIWNNFERKQKNFKSSRLIALDIDSGCSIEHAKFLFKDYEFLILTTKSHLKEKNGEINERFRIILVLEKNIESLDEFFSLMIYLKNKYNFIDKQCLDAARLFFLTESINPIFNKGLFFPIPQISKEAIKMSFAIKNDIIDNFDKKYNKVLKKQLKFPLDKKNFYLMNNSLSFDKKYFKRAKHYLVTEKKEGLYSRYKWLPSLDIKYEYSFFDDNGRKYTYPIKKKVVGFKLKKSGFLSFFLTKLEMNQFENKDFIYFSYKISNDKNYILIPYYNQTSKEIYSFFDKLKQKKYLNKSFDLDKILSEQFKEGNIYISNFLDLVKNKLDNLDIKNLKLDLTFLKNKKTIFVNNNLDYFNKYNYNYKERSLVHLILNHDFFNDCLFLNQEFKINLNQKRLKNDLENLLNIKVSLSFISRSLSKFQKDNWLIKKKNYFVGKQCIQYTLEKNLSDFIIKNKKIINKQENKDKYVNLFNIPAPSEGEFNNYIFKITKFFNNFNDLSNFMEKNYAHFLDLKPERRDQMRKAWENHEKRQK